jgi:hypothetical protein
VFWDASGSEFGAPSCSEGRLGRGNRDAFFFLRRGKRKKVVVVVVCVVVVVEYAIGCSPELTVERDDSDNLGPGRGSDAVLLSS